jgi:hypothetical protein
MKGIENGHRKNRADETLNKEYIKKSKMKITKNLLYWSGYVGGPTMAVIAKNVHTYKLQSLT